MNVFFLILLVTAQGLIVAVVVERYEIPLNQKLINAQLLFIIITSAVGLMGLFLTAMLTDTWRSNGGLGSRR